MKTTALHFVNLIALFALIAVSASILTSCQPEGCTDPMSDNYDPKAKVDDGSCVPWRDKFIANYTGTNACTGSSAEDVSIVITTSGTTEDGIVITVPGAGLIFTATVDAKDSFTVPVQEILYKGAPVDISGSGGLSGAELTINYDLAVEPLSVSCSLAGNQL